MTSWSDVAITSVNPNANLTDAPIKLTWLPTRGITQVFARGLASFIAGFDPVLAAELEANATLAYLPAVLSGSATAMASTTTAMQYVTDNDNTLAYYIYDTTAASPPPRAQLINRAGY